MKKTLFLLLLVSFILTGINSAQAETASLYLNGEKHDDGLTIYRLKEVDYVSINDIRNLLNFSVGWDAVAQRMELKTGKGEISLLINNPRIIVNENIRYLNHPARLLNGGIIVPIQFLTDFLPGILGCRINWLAESSRMEIETRDTVIIGGEEDFSQVKLSAHDSEEEKSSSSKRSSRKRQKTSPPGTYSIDLVVIDPGHGGRDPGAIGRKGLKEKDVVLDIANRVARKLKDNGTRVILTRSQDKFIPLDERTAIANRNRADLFLSIHANAAFTRRASGFETYYVSEAVDDHARAVAAIENSVLELEKGRSRKKLDDTLHAILWDLAYTEFRVESIEWGEIVQRELVKRIRRENRGVKPGPFYVLKGAQMPSLLVEVGFISNVVEENALRKSSYRDKIADALAKSIIRYKKIYEKKAGFTR